MHKPASFDRRTALAAMLSVTAASWWPAARANTPAAAQPAQLRIGFQKGSFNLVLLKSLGLLGNVGPSAGEYAGPLPRGEAGLAWERPGAVARRQRLPGTTVSWVEFPAGPQLLEALAVGSVDIGATGDSPPVFAQAAGKDLLYVGAEPPKPDTSAILVKPEAPLKTLADLKGRRIALQKGSSAHYLVVQAVKRGGLQWADIQPVYLPPADARAAFERGSVDAWAIWDPYYAAAEIDSHVRALVTSRNLTGNNTFYLASRAFARHEALVHQVFAALTETDAYVQAYRKESAQRYADFAGLGLATVHRLLERRTAAPVAALTPALVADQQRVADAFAQLGLIPKPIRVADAVWQPAQTLAQTR